MQVIVSGLLSWLLLRGKGWFFLFEQTKFSNFVNLVR